MKNVVNACVEGACSCWTESTRCRCRKWRRILSGKREPPGRPCWTERLVLRPSLALLRDRGFRNDCIVSDTAFIFHNIVSSVCRRSRTSLRVRRCSLTCAGPTTPLTTRLLRPPNLCPRGTPTPTRK